MKSLLFATLITFIPIPVLASDFGLSINIGQPGFYGQINLGNNYPRPQLIYPQPVLVREVRRNVWEHQSSVYLHVPSHHSNNWHQHCHRYEACNLSVYFVRENWYNDVYSPHHNNYSNRRYDSNRRHNAGHQDRHYDSDHDYRERRRDSHREYDDHYQERRYGSHDDHYKERRHDRKRHKYDDNHKGKHDKGHKGRKNHDRDRGRH